jgi:hypothetical protein
VTSHGLVVPRIQVGVGDRPAVTFSHRRTGVVTRKGDAVVRVDRTARICMGEPSDFGARPVNALLQKMHQ